MGSVILGRFISSKLMQICIFIKGSGSLFFVRCHGALKRFDISMTQLQISSDLFSINLIPFEKL